MHFGPSCMQLRALINIFLLFGNNSSPEKVQHFLLSPNSLKIALNGLFFGALTGGAFMLGPLHQDQHSFERPTPLLSKLKFPPYQKNRRLSKEKTFFSDSPEGFVFFWASGEYF